MIFQTKCKCGCGETHFIIGFNKLWFCYFKDSGEWWTQIKVINKIYSYSPCQGFMKFKAI